MVIGSGYDEYAFVAELYDHVGPYRTRRDVTFFLDAAVNAGSPVVEIGCGTGRVLIPTARAGVEIVGVDSSPHMLSVCRERLQHEGEGILLIFDNAIDADALKPYLPRGGAARVLLTSNAHTWRASPSRSRSTSGRRRSAPTT